MEIEVKIKIKTKRISDLISNGIAHGIDYWCSSCRSSEDFDKLKDKPDTFIEHEDNKSHQLTHEKAVEGLKLMAKNFPDHFGDFMAEKDDATTADVFIQLCLFKDIVYA